MAWALALCASLPPLVFRYLPMTDLPQHVAMSAILGNLSDPSLGFSACYAPSLSRSPYLLPYALAIGLGRLLGGLEAGWRVVVFLSVAVYPVAVLLWLRRLGKSPALVALAVPLVYHRGFFWGFVAFDLGIGLALLALALLDDVRGRRGALLALLLLAIGLTHVYGVLLFLGGAVLLWLCGERRDLRRQLLLGALAAALLVPWVVTEGRAPPLGGWASPSTWDRLSGLPDQVLGGYRDGSEGLLLALLLAAVLAFTWRGIPLGRVRWRRLQPAEKALWLAFAGNLLLYFVLPRATPTAKFVHFRHGVIAALLLPLLTGRELWDRSRLVAATLLVAVGAGGLLNAWDHLRLFDREARAFERVIAAVPPRPRLLALTFERDGRLMETGPYMHFGGYVQARRGGVFSMGFPEFFWNVPVVVRPECGMPPTPVNLEWHPTLMNAALVPFYDTLLVRRPEPGAIAGARFPYDLVFEEVPWQVYRRRGS